MRQVTLAGAIDDLGSSRKADKLRGVKDLEQLLKGEHQSPQLQRLPESDFHYILEELFKIVADEKSQVLADGNSSKVPSERTKGRRAETLSSCAFVVRKLLEIGAHASRDPKTVRAVLDHVLNATRGDDGEFFEPVLDSYFKALEIILGHPNHTERLSDSRWADLIRFCCESLSYIGRVRETEIAPESQAVLSNRPGLRSKSTSRSATPSQSKDPPDGAKTPQRQSLPLSSQRAGQLASCLELLLRVTHVNPLHMCEQIVSVIFETLKSTLEESRPLTQEHCFSCVRILFLKALTEDIDLARSIFTSAVYYIRRSWSGRLPGGSAALRDHMLSILIPGQSLIRSLIKDGSNTGDITNELAGLLDRLYSEYQERKGTEHLLQTSDLSLDLGDYCIHENAFNSYNFSLSSINSSSEASWAQLNIMADLFYHLRSLPYLQNTGNERDGTHLKRVRHESPLHALIRAISTSQGETQLSSLQYLTFILAAMSLQRTDDLLMLLENLFPLISKDTSQVSSWAMLSLSIIAQQEFAKGAILQETTWLQIFLVSINQLSSNRNSRFACHLADSILNSDLISFQEAADSLDGILTSIDVSGPSNLSDAAISFWRTVLALYSVNRAASYESVSGNILRWLFSVWKPSQLNLRRSSGATSPNSATTFLILNLLEVLVGEKTSARKNHVRRAMSALGKAKWRCHEDADLIGFLVDGKTPSLKSFSRTSLNLKRVEPQLSEKAKRAALTTACEYLIIELEAFLSTQSGSLATDQLSQLNLRNSLALCVVSFGIADILTTVDISRSNQLLNLTTEMRDQIAKAFQSQDSTQDQLNILYDTLLGVFQDLRFFPLNSLKELSCFELAIARTARAFNGDFWQQARNSAAENEDDLIGTRLESTSQKSRAIGPVSMTGANGFSPNWLDNYTDSTASINSTKAEMCLAASVPDPDSVSQEEAKSLPGNVVDYLLSLNPLDFLACRPFLDDIYNSKIEINQQDGARLLTFLATEILESDFLERNETAIGTCLDMMNHLVKHWAATEMDTDVSDAANQLYEYFVKAAKKRTQSDHVKMKMARMLQRVIKKSAFHGRSSRQPSARTILFGLLESGSVKVKFHISQNMAAVFGFFLLRDHDKILDDIERNIPHDPESAEITAVRLFLLSRLASSWSTLIRRCIYAIVDATGLMSEVTIYAHACLRDLCERLAIPNLRALFKLFVPQILYTWLETRTVESLPYSIFDYQSLKDLVLDVKHEVASQIIMRGKDEEIDVVSSLANIKFKDLLQESFGKCAAYCIARDTAIAPEADPKAADANRRLRHHLGRDEYAKLVASRFPEILATFFKILDREDQITRSFHKNPSHAAAQEALEQMILSGASQYTPPVSQQPSFQSNYLINEIKYICQRSPYDAQHLWTPPLYVYVFRGLLETIHPALGQLHAAAVVRRIRILVCMASKIALEGYPLEMTLGSLRAHLNNTHSAEDVMGLYRYLLKMGESYLSQNVSFTAGFIVSVLVSLKALREKPQESTTQESAFQATLTRAQDFHAWITKYAASLTFQSASAETQQSFQEIVGAASNLQSRGNSRKDSMEGDLLYRLLQDNSSGQHLIDVVTRKAIVSSLCRDFQSTTDYRNDILVNGIVAATHVPSLLGIFGLHGLDLPFNLWILRSIARAYASCGFIEDSFQREIQEPEELQGLSSETSSLHAVSASAIVKLLFQVACAHDPSEAGIAERTTQALLSKAVTNSDLKEVTTAVPPQALPAMDWQIYIPPDQSFQAQSQLTLQDALLIKQDTSYDSWCMNVCLSLADSALDDSFLSCLRNAIKNISGFAGKAFPYILHLILLREAGKQEQTKKTLSTAFHHMMTDYNGKRKIYVQSMIRAVIYLRTQSMPYENTKSDRTRWLEIDYRLAAEIALRCSMFKTALLFIEIALSDESIVKGSRRSSAATKIEAPIDLLLQIFQNIDEKDYYYGVRQPTSLGSMMDRLDMEQAGFRSLSFRGASFDVDARHKTHDDASINALIRSLNNLELSSLSQAIATSTEMTSELSDEVTFDAARKLEKWDIPCPDITSVPAVTLFKAFQSVQSASDRSQIHSNVNLRLQSMLGPILNSSSARSTTGGYWATLASLIEFEQVLNAKGPDQLQEIWEELESRSEWLRSGKVDHTERILSSRQTLFSTLNICTNLQHLIKSPPKQTRLVQVRSLLLSSEIRRSQGEFQKSLSSATAIERLAPRCQELGLRIEAATRAEVSNVLWDSGEMGSSVRILQDLSQNVDFSKQDISVSRPELMAKLAQRVSEARLEQPDEILTRYLEPAVKELRGSSSGPVAGRVFHEFASFCDQQLQNIEGVEDYHRAQKLRDDKAEEIRELDQMIKSAAPGSRERENLKSYRTKAKQWYDLDNAEFKRLQNSRDILLKQSLENYLKCLKACDNFDRDAIRFSALWLEHHDEDVANEIVGGHLGDVSSRKFATLMNQWTSRLLDEDVPFQTLLSDTIYRICADHPYHGMYNVFASSRSKGGKDQGAMSRHAAANAVVGRLRANKEINSRWLALHNSCVQYVRFASEKPEDGKYRQGSKILLEKSQSGVKLQEVIGMRMPPATMKIELRKDCNYKNVPVIVKWSREFSIASGISAPKIVTATASNGQKYKQLFKAGNDDLRQDAIMEQVFEQVSELLVEHRETRQRRLGIRSYKVLPLTSGAGIIEFVANTIPINDYLVPAHAEHYPNDLKANVARKIIYEAAASRRNDHRVMEFRRVCERLHPVLRHFFMERFENPDDWFERRLNYTRTTAAISMLGHILGLGDRHGHNILLDEKTGEVVHIDLGIAFEQGRILPVPELVPFRLTRDIVDGFGVTRTEGVFRRCCEFTLDALRREAYSIMTILDVLRYDPLYSWSLSPLRLKRLQEDKLAADAAGEDAADDKSVMNNGGGGNGGVGAGAAAMPGSERAEKKDNEEAEADRALTVVQKKLSRGLSIEATVNELIQQATDERNLALLFAGWAAYI